MDKFIFILCLIVIGCTNKTKKIYNDYCKLDTITSKAFIESRDFFRLKQLILKIPDLENDKNEIIIFRQYPNGGIDEDNHSYVTVLKDNSKTAETFFFVGRDFTLSNSYHIDSNNLKKLLNEFEKGFYHKKCDCEGGEDGVFFVGNSKLIPNFGVMFTCYNPTSWRNLTSIERNTLKIINYQQLTR